MIENGIKEKLSAATSGPLFFDEPLSHHTTIRVGGPADALAHPMNQSELKALLALAREALLPVFILGGGSNLLVRDGGIRGLVLNLTRGFNGLEITGEEGDVVGLRAEAGVLVPGLMNFVIKEGLTGLEFMAGIPASIGGALAMNAGIPDGEIGDRVKTVTVLEKNGRLRTLDRGACGFAYRKTAIPKSAIILEGHFELQRGNSETIRERIETYKAKRVATQPLNYPNVGSVFKNPPKKHVGQLIEEAGLKNVRVGQARISEKHGNFIINEGRATAKDVITLIGLMKDKIKERFNISLETEVHIVGEG